MVLKLSVLVIAAAYFSAFRAAAAADRKIPSDAPTKWTAYMEFAKQLQGTWSEVVTDRRANNNIGGRSRLEFKIRGFAMKYGYQFLGPKPEADQRWFVRNEKYGFELHRRRDTDSWVLNNLYENIGDGKNLGKLNLFLSETTTRTFAPFRIYRVWLPEAVQQQEFVVKNLAQVTKGGLDLTRVEFQYTEKRKPAVQSGWVLLDPSLYWIVRGYEVKIMGATGSRGTATYTADFKLGQTGMPLLTKSVERIEVPEEGPEQADGVRTIEYSLDEQKPSAAEFTLAAFGLPEPGETGSFRYLWLAAIGLLCLVVAIALWFRGRRGIQAFN